MSHLVPALQVHKFSSTQFTLLGSFDEDIADRGCKGEVVFDLLFVCQETGESEEAKEKVPDIKDAQYSESCWKSTETEGSPVPLARCILI